MELPAIRSEKRAPSESDARIFAGGGDGLHRRPAPRRSSRYASGNADSDESDTETDASADSVGGYVLTEADRLLTEAEFTDKYLNSTVWGDLAQALYDVRLTAPLFVLLGVFLAYHLTIAPYRTHIIDVPGGMGRGRDIDLVYTQSAADYYPFTSMNITCTVLQTIFVLGYV